MRLPLILSSLLALGACTPNDPPAPQPSVPGVQPGTNPGAAPRGPVRPDPADACGAANLQALVGQPVPADLTGPGPVRIVPENGAMTMDYNPERLTVIVSADSRRIVLSVSCG